MSARVLPGRGGKGPSVWAPDACTPADSAFPASPLVGEPQPGVLFGLGEVERGLPPPQRVSPGLGSGPGRPPLPPCLASTVAAKRKKLGDRCHGNVPTRIPSINHQLLGRQAPV